MNCKHSRCETIHELYTLLVWDHSWTLYTLGWQLNELDKISTTTTLTESNAMFMLWRWAPYSKRCYFCSRSINVLVFVSCKYTSCFLQRFKCMCITTIHALWHETLFSLTFRYDVELPTSRSNLTIQSTWHDTIHYKQNNTSKETSHNFIKMFSARFSIPFFIDERNMYNSIYSSQET